MPSRWPASSPTGQPRASKTTAQAMTQIVLADLSMSLDNVLAVAGVARDHPYILAIGLVLSVALMGIASTYVARLLDRLFWLAWVGPRHHHLRRAADDLGGLGADPATIAPARRSIPRAAAPADAQRPISQHQLGLRDQRDEPAPRRW